jgi:hypothetical protein
MPELLEMDVSDLAFWFEQAKAFAEAKAKAQKDGS